MQARPAADRASSASVAIARPEIGAADADVDDVGDAAAVSPVHAPRAYGRDEVPAAGAGRR